MTDIVIPYVHSRWQDQEVKYALRGVEKYLTGVRNVVIIGDMPAKITGVIHIPHPADTRIPWKEKNIYERIRLACEDERVSDRFLYMNDDHFLLSEYEAAGFPGYYSEWPNHNGAYQHTLNNSREICTRFYDVHCPMLISKQRFIATVGALDWNKKFGYCMKSVYAKGLPGEEYPGMKIREQNPIGVLRRMVAGRKWFSVCDQSRGPELERLLNELYPVKSKYEL